MDCDGTLDDGTIDDGTAGEAKEGFETSVITGWARSQDDPNVKYPKWNPTRKREVKLCEMLDIICPKCSWN
jgi:hypothetical protein